MGSLWKLIRDTVCEFYTDETFSASAALAFYATLALAPIAVIALWVAGVWNVEEAREELVHQIDKLIGPEGRNVVHTVVREAERTRAAGLAAVLSAVTLLFAATGIFAQLQVSLNAIWGVEQKPGRAFGVWQILKTRILSLGLVISVGFLLLVSLVVSWLIHLLVASMHFHLPGEALFWPAVNFVVSFAMITLMIALVFKVLPDVRIRWRDVWIGASITAALFTAGKELIGLYLGQSTLVSAYGAAGSLTVVLVWTYYSSAILLLGAEFTQVYCRLHGTRIRPAAHAVAVGKRRPREENAGGP